MLERLKSWCSRFTLPRTVSLLLDAALGYSSWKLYGVVLPLTMGNWPIAGFNAAMLLAFGMIVHRVLRRLATTCRIVVLITLYGLKFGTAGMFSLAAHVPDVEAHRRLHSPLVISPGAPAVPAILVSETVGD